MLLGGGPGQFRHDDYNVKLTEVDPSVYRRLAQFIRPHIGRLLLGILLMVVVILSGLVGPRLVQLAIDLFIKEQNQAGLNRVALALLATALLNWWSGVGQTYVISRVGQEIIYTMRESMFDHLQRLSFRFYDSMVTGRIMARLMSDVDAINQLVSSGLVSVFADSFTLLAIMGVMLSMNARLALVSFLTIPLLLLAIQYFKVRLRNAFVQQRRKSADMNANLAESISGVRVTQSFTREGHNKESFNQINEQNRQANIDVVTIWAMFLPTIEVVSAFGTTLVLWYGGALIRGGAPDITVGQVTAFILYLTRFFQPLRDLSQVYNVFQSAVVSAERVVEVLDQQPEVEDLPSAYTLPAVKGSIQFKHVTFGYNPEQPVLKDINIQAEPGQTIALVGPTGAGKSSIINLLGRFYDPQQGCILIDGHDLRTVTQASWRSQIGVVLQDPFLFSGSIRENIRYGRPTATDAEVEMVARTVGAHEFIERLPAGYETDVMERGTKLSMGQRQLIAFARALCANPSVLILDEATSNIDTYTEKLLQDALATLRHNRTSVIIAHRLSTIRSADRIYLIDEGHIKEEGTHEELMEKGGRYASLYMGGCSEVDDADLAKASPSI